MDPIRKLHAASRTFGEEAARLKVELLEAIAAAHRRLGPRQAALLGETLDFLRAYPDSPRVLGLARRLLPRLPATDTVYAYSYAVVRRLIELHPGGLEIEWDDLESEDPLLDLLPLLVLPGEGQGLEDIRIDLQDWFAAARPHGSMTDLEFLVGLLEASGLPEPVRVLLFESCNLPIRYRGPGRSTLDLLPPRPRYQRRPIRDARPPIARLIRQPLDSVRRGEPEIVDRALHALSPRHLEIYPLIYANPADVTLADCGRHLQIALVGVRPEWRSPLEVLTFFLVFKNGVPIAYGPAAVLLGCCELGINLFPEFRGGETRYLYAQFMRVLHHVMGADYFFLTRYGMGENNDEAIRTGAFWFYRKLGLRPTNPEVEKLARAEEARRAADPSHRSDRRMLRRLSRTEAYLDLSGGLHRPLDLGSLGLAESRLIAARFGGDRRRARRHCAARVARLLGIESAGTALGTLAPVLCLIPDLETWSGRERSALRRFLRVKGGASELPAARLLARHRRLPGALRRLASGSARS